jgi:multidrug efflux system outer membrane protein
MRAGVLVPALAAIFATGCLVGPDYQRPHYPVPPSFRGQPAATLPAGDTSFGDLEWWRIFEDEQLVELVRTALAANYDLQRAAQRILDARTQVTVARSFLYPTINAGINAPYTRFVGRTGEFNPGSGSLDSAFLGQGGVGLDYEIDFWGRIRRGSEAARAQLLASEWAQRAVVSTLVADVASAYLELTALDQQLEVARRTLTSREDSVRLVTLREQGGVASLIDVQQAEVLREQAAEAIPLLERLIEQTENGISTLLGRDPGPVPRGKPLEQQLAAPMVPPGLTSALLERRPDIRQAEQALVATNAQIGVAKAQLFPLVTLTGFAGVGGNVFNGAGFGPFGLFGIAPGISLPLFNAGRLQAGVDSAEARTQDAVLRYQQTIQQAFREVADALIGHEKNREFRVQKEFLVQTLRTAVQLANIRYQGGVTSYLEVLDADTRLFVAELDLVRANQDERLAIVQLYKALGGGWEQPPPQGSAGPAVEPVALRIGGASVLAPTRASSATSTGSTIGWQR